VITVSGSILKKYPKRLQRLVDQGAYDGIVLTAFDAAVHLKRVCPIGTSRNVKGMLGGMRQGGLLRSSIAPRFISKKPPVSAVIMYKYGRILDFGMAGPHRHSERHKDWVWNWVRDEGRKLFLRNMRESIRRALLKGVRKERFVIKIKGTRRR